MAPNPTLLIVEDDVDVAEMLGAYFRVQGYEVETVHWGEEAVDHCQAVIPDLVILDIRLPDIDGYEVAQRLRTSHQTNRIPIIFLTEKREREDRLRGLSLGADDYITKPFDIQELRLRVRNALRRTDQPPLLNPVTGLPEASLVEEQMASFLQRDDWAFLLIRLEGVEPFREAYGFVASDDALRAISLMITNIVHNLGNPNDFVGHLEAADFIVLTTTSRAKSIQETLERRLRQALTYFYPLQDRPGTAREPTDGGLAITTSSMAPDVSPWRDPDSVRRELIARLAA